MTKGTKATCRLLSVIPVLPSEEIKRDVDWYNQYVGFETVFQNDMYAVLNRDQIYLHLQWHADTEDDPLLGGSVIRILVDDIYPIFNEFLQRGTVRKEKLRLNTPWQTNEFGFYDLNKNAVFITQDIKG